MVLKICSGVPLISCETLGISLISEPQVSYQEKKPKDKELVLAQYFLAFYFHTALFSHTQYSLCLSFALFLLVEMSLNK